MVTFGLIDRWSPEPGIVTVWRPDPASVRAARVAPESDVPPTHIQQAYLEDSYRMRAENRSRGLDIRFSRLCLISFDLPGRVDHDAMTRAVTAFVTRHDTFLSWFEAGDHGPVRHVVDPADVQLEIVSSGNVPDSDAIRSMVQQSTPGPDAWECFTFGTIQRPDGFSVYAAVDHLVTDGISQALTIFDLRQLYETACHGEPAALFESGSYVEHCARERTASAALTADSPSVRRWIEIVQANDGDLPSFPLDLGRQAGDRSRTADGQFPMLDTAQADGFDAACAAVAVKFSGGLFAAAALAQYELTGRCAYVGMSPKSTRATPGEWASVGWFASLVPVAFDLAEARTFREVAVLAQRAFDAGKTLGDTSFHRVLELARPEDGVRTTPGWSVPMISYVDVRRLPGVELLADANVGLYANRGTSEEVYLWVNRFPDHTSATFLYPGTAEADAAVTRWYALLREIFLTVARDGDRAVGTPVGREAVASR